MIRRKQLPAAEADTPPVIRPHPRSWYVTLDAVITEQEWATWAAPLAAAFCADTGRPADPVVYLKIFLIAHLENLVYDTALAERIHDSVAIRRFLRYALHEATPEHDAISRVRAEVAVHVDIDAVLDAIVTDCIAARMVDGTRVAVDTTLIPANASLQSLESVTTGQSVQDALRAAKAADPTATPTVSNTEFRSTTDPDARIRVKRGHPRDMYYTLTHVTDSRRLVILAARVDHADEGEPESAQPAVRTAAARLKRHDLARGLLIGDTGFDAGDFHAQVALAGFTPLTNYKLDAAGKPPGFQKVDFTYDAATDSYRCPHGHVLRYKCTDPTRDLARYVSDAPDCAGCPDAPSCLSATGTVRWLSRPRTPTERSEMIARCHTPDGRDALRARKHIVEPPFGYLKTHGGLGLMNCRGLDKAHVKGVLGAVAFNLIRLVRCRMAPLRPAPAVVAAVTALAAAAREYTSALTAGIGQMKRPTMGIAPRIAFVWPHWVTSQ